MGAAVVGQIFATAQLPTKHKEPQALKGIELWDTTKVAEPDHFFSP
jgi:hypothetical protein